LPPKSKARPKKTVKGAAGTRKPPVAKSATSSAKAAGNATRSPGNGRSNAKSGSARELPKAAQAILAKTLAKVVDCLAAAAPKVTVAGSGYMDYDGAMGGQVLDSSPAVEHPYAELAKLYEACFKKAKTGGLPLREIQTQLRKGSKGWQHQTRWLGVSEYKAFAKGAAPLVEELRVALRANAERLAKDWYRVSFLSGDENKAARLLVLHGDEGRIERKPPAELSTIARRIGAVAESQGLSFTGGEWDVESEMDDAADGIESAMGVIGPSSI
jgi:hypothetical protein